MVIHSHDKGIDAEIAIDLQALFMGIAELKRDLAIGRWDLTNSDIRVGTDCESWKIQSHH